MSLLALWLPYGLYPLAVFALLRRLGWRGGDAALLPLALGAGPLIATSVLEAWLWLVPGPPRLLAIGVLAAVPLVGLVCGARALRGAGLLAPSSLASATCALALLGFLWFQMGDHLMFDWDPACFRLVADRIAAEGTVDPYALILEPTVNELLLIHPFHGLRYPLLMTLNRVLADSRLAILDALPAAWFLWCSVLLVGGAVAGREGWQGARPWLGAWFALLSCQSLLWATVGQSASVAGFTLLAVVLACLRAAQSSRADGTGQWTHWLFAGLLLGLAAGVHRTSYAYGIVYLALACAARPWSAPARLPAILAGGCMALLVCLPFEAHYQLEIGGLARANPVSPGLVPYRATWREAFEVAPLGQAWQQFWVWELDALQWWGGALGGAWALWWYVARRRGGDVTRDLTLALSVAGLVLAVALSDLALLLFHAGQELTVRSTRYRTHLQPLLAWVGVLALLRAPLPRVAPRGTVWALLFLFAGAAAVVGLMRVTMPGQLVSSVAQATQRWRDITNDDEVARLVAREPDLAEVLRHLARQPPDGQRLLLDYPSLFRWIDRPMRSLWLNPGVFPLLDATDPAAAAQASRVLGIRWHLYRVNHSGTELYSATGLRHGTAAAAAALVVDTRRFQLFENDDAPHAVRDVTPPRAPLTSHGKRGKDRARVRQQQLFAAPIATPGDYELSIDFDDRQPLDVTQMLDGRAWRRFRLRAWRPTAPGPQRIRFRVVAGQTAQFVVPPAAAKLLEQARVSLWLRD